MTDEFIGYQVTKDDDVQNCTLTTLTNDDLMDGDVTIDVAYSTLNYKDGLALTGRSPVVRKFPLTPGIDFSGTVTESSHHNFKQGDQIILNGFGVGEVHSGGYAQRARVNGDWLIHLPEGISNRQSMAIGTAGYTSMLCVMALQNHGLTPADGEIIVTGATGGVGSVAVALLSKAGFDVVAVTGKASEADYLTQLGAKRIIERSEFADKARPLSKELWAGAIDVAGGNTLANVISQMQYGGAVAACGLAESMSLPTSVAPFILRGVTLYGVDSVMASTSKRIEAWNKLSLMLDMDLLDSLSFDLDFHELPSFGEAILDGKVRGRAIIEIPGS